MIRDSTRLYFKHRRDRESRPSYADALDHALNFLGFEQTPREVAFHQRRQLDEATVQVT